MDKDEYCLDMASQAAKVAHRVCPDMDYEVLLANAWLIIHNQQNKHKDFRDLYFPATYFARAAIRLTANETKHHQKEISRDSLDDFCSEPLDDTPDWAALLGDFRRLRNRLDRAIYAIRLAPNTQEEDIRDAIALGYSQIKKRPAPKKRYKPGVRKLAELFEKIYFSNPRK
ncbi:hypothetical protein ACJU26_09365 [Acidithiobacillus sp. M4-SHS-6]|uniref:hypothetical protein n=1 Tax=Acidithiobacillus sp. M4-SHS-6 TaxID=3383024 RepID=UPI0039BDFAC8